MADDSRISDDLLRTLIGVGHADLLVGVPTLNHAAAISEVIRAIEASFRTYFPRQRTVLINSDAGSTDDTLAVVQSCCADQARTVTASSGLRTTHRISTPYHGIPGKANAVRMILSAADLLQASGVVILDPDVANITPKWIAALAVPLRDQQCDFVAPVYRRQVAEGHLITQLLRPLTRAIYGRRIREPLVGEFGCSGRFAVHCAEQEAWNSDIVQNGMNLWITGTALAGSFTVTQAELGTRHLVPDAPWPTLADLFQQVINTAFAMIEAHEGYWLTRTVVENVPVVGTSVEEGDSAEIEPPDGARILEPFDQDVSNLQEILGVILTEETLAAVKAAAGDRSGAGLTEELWATTVGEFLVAYRHHVMRRDHITQALLPLYRARAGTFLLEHANSSPEAAEAAHESLCVHFEQVKARVVDRWRNQQ